MQSRPYNHKSFTELLFFLSKNYHHKDKFKWIELVHEVEDNIILEVVYSKVRESYNIIYHPSYFNIDNFQWSIWNLARIVEEDHKDLDIIKYSSDNQKNYILLDKRNLYKHNSEENSSDNIED